MHNLLLRRPTRQFARETALPHHQNSVGNLQQFRQFGADHQDRCAGSRKTIHHLEDFDLGADIDAARRFIEQENFGAARQPLGNHNLLLITAAQAACQLIVRGALDAQLADVFLETACSAPRRRIPQELSRPRLAAVTL